jgi:hypothetical protein
MREVLVRQRNQGSYDQLALFHAATAIPAWMSLPAEVREQTLRWLARLLRDRCRDRAGVAQAEVAHE